MRLKALGQKLHPRRRDKMFRCRSRAFLAFAAMVAMLVYVASMRAADDRGTLEGVVKSATGQPLTGAFVKLKNPERRLTFMVISQERGHYAATDLPTGKYTVQGVGSGFQSAWSSLLDVSSGKPAKLDLMLTN